MPRIRVLSEDFEVEEVALYPPCGEGEHTFLQVEKRDLDTEGVVECWAKLLSIRAEEIGYAGRKDRRAVTRQWISVPRFEPSRAEILEIPGVRILQARRHRQKIRAGDLRANRFRIVVRDVGPADATYARARFQEVLERGLTNRFGRQRFGYAGSNVEKGADVLRGKKVPGGRRHLRFMVSAFQAHLFNEVLDRRPVPPWELLEGDLALFHLSGGLSQVRSPADEAERLGALEISPTGPLFGAKMRRPAGAAAEIEDGVWEEQGLPPWHEIVPSRGLRIMGARRPFRVPVEEATCDHREDRLELSFQLPAGSFATTLVEHLFPELAQD